MQLIKVARVPPVLATPNMTVAEAAKLMLDKQVGAVVVTNPLKQVLGIFTERDNLVRITAVGCDPKTTPLIEAMTTPVTTAPPEMPVDEALTLMIRSHFRHLPIVDSSNRIIGIASIRYLLMRRLGEKQATVEILSAYVEAGGPG